MLFKKIEFIKKIDHELLQNFIQISRDQNLYHISEEYCMKKGLKGIVIHGMLISSIASYIPAMSLALENSMLVSQTFTYHKPCYVGDSYKFVGEVLNYDKRFKLVKVGITVYDIENKQMASGIFQMKYLNKSKQ